MWEIVAMQMQLSNIQADCERGVSKREAEKQALWQTRFNEAGHEERMQMIEMRKLEEMAKQTKAIKDAADKTAEAIKQAGRDAAYGSSLPRHFD